MMLVVTASVEEAEGVTAEETVATIFFSRSASLKT
jgi:hypothetical protein